MERLGDAPPRQPRDAPQPGARPRPGAWVPRAAARDRARAVADPETDLNNIGQKKICSLDTVH